MGQDPGEYGAAVSLHRIGDTAYVERGSSMISNDRYPQLAGLSIVRGSASCAGTRLSGWHDLLTTRALKGDRSDEPSFTQDGAASGDAVAEKDGDC